MNPDFLRAAARLYSKSFPGEPPGSLTEIVDHPTQSGSMAVNIGIVQEHRFAFWHWVTWRQKQAQNEPIVPHLITIDRHDDVGCDSDFDHAVIQRLDLSDPAEVAFFSWCGLRSLNDGHIRPAQYLDQIQNAYVLTPKEADDFSFEDLSGKQHDVMYFKNTTDLLGAVRRDATPVILDIDLDYFVADDEQKARYERDSKLRPRVVLQELLGLGQPLMQELAARLRGVTIALEPEYCGGLKNSLKILNWLSEEWFDGSLAGGNCTWRRL